MLTLDPGRVSVVTLDRPPANALTRDFFAELMDVLDRLRTADVRAVVVTGTGRFFSAGLDLFEVFGTEMTTAVATCISCGASGQVAAQRESLARATAALDRAIEVLMPSDAPGLYSSIGGPDRGLRGGVIQA